MNYNTLKRIPARFCEAVSPDFHDNTLPKGRPQGYAGIPFASANFRKAVPDLACSIEDFIVTKDKIICRQIYTGHNTGPVMGHPASGNAIRFFAIDILHVRNGKIYEDWHLEDNLTFLSFHLISLFSIMALTAGAQDAPPPTINIGDPAPPLHIRSWPKGAPVVRMSVPFWVSTFMRRKPPPSRK